MPEIVTPNELLNNVNSTGQKIAQRIKSTPYLPQPSVVIPAASQVLTPLPLPVQGGQHGE